MISVGKQWFSSRDYNDSCLYTSTTCHSWARFLLPFRSKMLTYALHKLYTSRLIVLIWLDENHFIIFLNFRKQQQLDWKMNMSNIDNIDIGIPSKNCRLLVFFLLFICLPSFLFSSTLSPWSNWSKFYAFIPQHFIVKKLHLKHNVHFCHKCLWFDFRFLIEVTLLPLSPMKPIRIGFLMS